MFRPGVNSGQFSTAAWTLQSDPSVLSCLATVRALERVQGGPLLAHAQTTKFPAEAGLVCAMAVTPQRPPL